MQIVIDIPDRIYNIVQNKTLNIIDSEIVEETIRNGTPLPKGHGKLKDADSILATAWTNFYKHEYEWEKKDPDYLPFGRMYDQN